MSTISDRMLDILTTQQERSLDYVDFLWLLGAPVLAGTLKLNCRNSRRYSYVVALDNSVSYSFAF